MALSKPVDPGTVRDVPVIAQHYLICGTEDCENNCQFYCNDCHQSMCEQCKGKHQESLETKTHEVVSYRQRKRKLPVEKCKNHPSKDIDMICESCKVPICYKCGLKDHQGHMFGDLETVYSDNFILCLETIYNIHQYFLPTSQDLQEDVKQDAKEMKAFMDKIRTSIRDEASFLKRLVDEVMTDNIEQVNKIEKSLMEKLISQDKIYEEYNDYLKNLVKEYNGYMSFDKVQNNPIVLLLSEHLKINPIPESTVPVYPVLSVSNISKDHIKNLLGYLRVPLSEQKNRTIKPVETVSSHLKPTGKQKKQNIEKSEVKERLSTSFSVTEVGEYALPVVESVYPSVYHISLGKSGTIWFSNRNGDLVQTDLIQGSQLQVIKTSDKDDGYHSITKDGDLIYTDKMKNAINRITLDHKITEFVKTGNWKPLCIHSSKISGDVLVGMSSDEGGKVTRYNKTGREIQNIQRDSKGQAIYSGHPHYITENINGDICVSDADKEAVVVVNKSGQHRFSYTGQESGLDPWGICTDILGHIIVCDNYNDKIHFLDQDGHLLKLLLTDKNAIFPPLSVCVDDKNNLHLGQWDTNIVSVFKYLQ